MGQWPHRKCNDPQRSFTVRGVCSDLNLEGPSSAHPARALARVPCTQGSGSAFSLQESAIGETKVLLGGPAR